MERLKESHTTIAENIDYISSLEEKLRIVKTMLDNYYRPEEVAYLVELPLEYIEAIEEKYEKCEKLVKQAVNKSFWNNKLINLFTKLQIEGFSINMKEELSNIHKKMVMKARRKIKLRVAYRMVDSDDFITNIARITGLEIKEVEYLADIFIIRREERERTTKR
ncbi:MAG: hypothetical protein BGO68_05075 [Candidatus Amoebophilus sp. 36-38]|nr:MAG: hypothetical protein BGO68_05075 [Candidatus Amoebophilus sp. 36-38]